MPWIEQHSDGYRVVWRSGGRNSPRQKSAVLPTVRDAAAELRAVTARLASQRTGRRLSAVPWAEIVERYAVSREDSTTAAHRDQVRACLSALAKRHGWRTTADVRPDQVLTLRPYHGRVLRALLRYAAIADQTVDTRCLLVRTLRDKRARRARDSELLTPETVANLVATATAWSAADGAIAHLVAVYGYRLTSLIGLPCSALSRDGALTLRVKSGDQIRAPLRSDTLKILRALAHRRSPDAPLFVGHLGAPWQSSREYASWWRTSVTTARGQGILDLRRFATTRQMEHGGQNARAVADAQGRRDASLVVSVYQRSTAEDRRRVVDAQPPLPAPTLAPVGPQRHYRKRVAL